MKEFKSSHNLPFESCPWSRNPAYQCFRVGTCEGQWFCSDAANAYCILTIINNQPGNGHLEDVFEYFIRSCKRDRKSLMVLEIMNGRFKKHLIEKRGFIPMMGTDHLIKFLDDL